jgi:hypothetical protein
VGVARFVDCPERFFNSDLLVTVMVVVAGEWF